MGPRHAIWIGMVVGSAVGSFIPSLWGAGALSMSSLLLGAAGALAGIWVAFRLTR